MTKDDLFQLQKKSGEIIKEVGKYILEAWPKIKEIHYKDVRDVVTNVDVEAEALLRAKLHTLLPEAGFIVEEGKTEKKGVYNWTIDPVDGTKYYAASTPLFLSQIALLENDIPVLGHIYNPTVKHLFSASRENGAYFNDEKFVVENKRTPNEAIVEVVLGGADDALDWKLTVLKILAKNAYRIRSLGSAYNVYILKGAFDAIVVLRQDFKDGKSSTDGAPGDIIYREANLTVCEEVVDGKKIRIIAHKALADFLYNKIRS